ncbi:hypothetical protein A3A93_04385 [Candidatus Roizmanbacteria bacterium RIFCSPLOWO2_01_FULL_38_12]|uniref:Nucleoside 2-deoxyribosyltransferase n=1 Tax=Candidatus Roizmanbacteria bacterium RIFCSPLOWO2_01_FULL_38_12 TaxID=1802061 RepID=A0A1F7IXE0_9BACT|nr:MAG: hypothetical protein A2861_01110 [Candidatus Roizmanbacteria bacterium RIFCSPHIGHO2_01_FULL_38_15]OGK35478.1 MAG: hypothetical protein A3F59_00890 [Candidatus Roizmanbacteria bacterium RIFCSPHIGHO2_12_FULL_38_13]OGK48011.1 MAG: hypothetical protein A3A93_04385 [Candidatus Roizmanbacteria bacterium RIFCSPLOWO2_01_FULL_38_12]
MTGHKNLKIYFTASIAAKQNYLDNYHRIVDHIKKRGHAVIADHIFNNNEKQISLKTREERLAFHNKLEKWIFSCDGLVAETSFPSISVGYEISLALRVGKPVLVLYSVGQPPSLLAHHRDEKLLCEKYSNNSLSQSLDDFLNFIQAKSDLRFTFFITPRIAAYLHEIARKNKLPKSVYLRKLIEKDMEENRRA